MSSRARRKKKVKSTTHTRTLSVRLEALEIARGHDGLLRGNPEPVLVVGAFLVRGTTVSLLGREVVEIRVPSGSFPLAIEAAHAVLTVEIARGEDNTVLLLVAAIEHDSGAAVEDMYARLAQPERLHAWRIEDPTPHPRTLAEIASAGPSSPPDAMRLRLLWDDSDVTTEKSGDDLVGTAVIVTHETSAKKKIFRPHFVSADEQNDWTAELAVYISS